MPQTTAPKLDIFPHIFPHAYFERMKEIAQGNPALAGQIKRWLHIPVLWDLDARMKMMKQFPGYQQVLTLSMPAIEFLAGPEESPALARHRERRHGRDRRPAPGPASRRSSPRCR